MEKVCCIFSEVAHTYKDPRLYEYFEDWLKMDIHVLFPRNSLLESDSEVYYGCV